jgi:hypothetical protein
MKRWRRREAGIHKEVGRHSADDWFRQRLDDRGCDIPPSHVNTTPVATIAIATAAMLGTVRYADSC